MKIRLQMKRSESTKAVWVDSEPFVENKRGILIHRPRYVCMYKIGDRWGAHIAIEFYCGATVTDTRERGNVTFLPAPPKGSLLCAACEARALMMGLPPASKLAGHHVCIGKLRAVNVCHVHGEAPQ